VSLRIRARTAAAGSGEKELVPHGVEQSRAPAAGSVEEPPSGVAGLVHRAAAREYLTVRNAVNHGTLRAMGLERAEANYTRFLLD